MKISNSDVAYARGKRLLMEHGKEFLERDF